MTRRPAHRRAPVGLIRAALVGGLVVLAPCAAWGAVVSSADLTFDRASDGRMSWWRPWLAIASPATEFGLPPTSQWLPAALLQEAGMPGTGFVEATRSQQISVRATHGSSWGHGTLTELRADWRLHAGSPIRGAWLSLGASGVAGGDRTLRLPLLGLGTWFRQQRVTLFGLVDQTLGYTPRVPGRTTFVPDHMTPESLWVYRAVLEPGRPGDMATITRAQVHAAYDRRALGVEAAGGVDVGRGLPPRRWAQASVAVATVPRVRLFASYGSSPVRLFVEESPGGSRAAVGLRLAPEPAVSASAPLRRGGEIESWRVAPEGQGRYRFSVRAARRRDPMRPAPRRCGPAPDR